METSGVNSYTSLSSLIGTNLTDEQMKTLPIDVLAFLVAAKQTSSVDRKMEISLSVLKGKQADIAEMRTRFAEIKELHAKASKGEKTTMPSGLYDSLAKFNVTRVVSSGNEVKKEDWEAQSAYLEAKMQELNCTIENDMLSVQGLMSRRNEALDLASNLIKKSDDSKASMVK